MTDLKSRLASLTRELPKGYYIYAAPVSTMTSADRAARKAPPISILVCGAGAIQYAAPTIIFQR